MSGLTEAQVAVVVDGVVIIIVIVVVRSVSLQTNTFRCGYSG